MASTSNPTQPQPQHHQTQTISIKAAARKLPVKRKSPEDYLPNPNPNFPPIPKIEPQLEFEDEDDDSEDLKRAPPFKFHRIWTESDEITFLQGLLDSSNTHGLFFPRDLPIFYNRFSNSMSQPYTRSQLSEKLRRLRKKFRVASARIARGLEFCLLSPHDRALFDLSKKLWDPDFMEASPFNAKNNKKLKSTGNGTATSGDGSVSVKVKFSPTFNPAAIPICNDNDDNDGNDNEDETRNGGEMGSEFGRVVLKSVLDVFDKSLKEVRMNVGLNTDSMVGRMGFSDFAKRWQEQRVEEMEVLACRLRLVIENSIPN
ncbi:hypothetical protein GIB67_006088 [Kingdonia uniflora]|uniref:Glabrous enhancer-binding protein-like DBD domain-containing protein n=1 Tax=Kingdonia uniflora TaxID=39325 RepID=A0A7J7LPK6_9MAGN|nr:hypothetical protein GIB67_006088 [Kingdonia uniflora]